MSTLTVENIGPVADLEASLPDGGGITVLVGPNDSGKSIQLQAASIALGGKGTVTKRDGTLRGQLSLCGVTMNVTGRARTIGDLDVETIEGRFDVSDLIEPGLKDPAAADAKRAKALLQIRGVGPDLERFAELLDGITPDPKWERAGDLVELAAMVRSALHEHARAEERQADGLSGQAAACRQAAEGVDLEAETDTAALQEKLTAATREMTRLEEQAKAAAVAQERAVKARATLGAVADGPTAKETGAMVEVVTESLERLSTEEDAAQQAYNAAVEARLAAEREVDRRNERHAEAQRREALLAQCNESIAAAENVPTPTPDEIQAATEKAATIRQAISQAGVTAKAHEKAAEAKELAHMAAVSASNSETFRARAKAVDEVLTNAVQSRHLRATADEKGRMRWITEQEGRGAVPYHDRSRGTRCAIAVDEAMAAMNGEGPSLILLRQDLWEGLDYENRVLLDRHCRECRVNILTAEASRKPGDKLHAVVFGGDPNATGGHAAVEETAAEEVAK